MELLLLLIAIINLSLCSNASPCLPDNDPQTNEIIDLPGLDFDINFKQYSGYLDVSNDTKYFYWFVESETNPDTAPVLLWLNGGPGCSSLDGLLTEHGPFLINPDGSTLRKNPYAWNKIANVIYLESPAGTGFSYSLGNTTYNDDETAENNYKALKDFYRRFPQYSDNDLYLSGESYGGIYVPTLAEKIYEDKKFNLKGMAIGNGLADLNTMLNSQYYMSYYMGLISSQQWNELLSACCTSDIGYKGMCDISSNDSPDCKIVFCLNTTAISTYLNDAKVQKALHVDVDYVTKPRVSCSGQIFVQYELRETSTAEIYTRMLTRGDFRAMLYYGVLDMMCPYIGGEDFANSLGFTIVEEWRPWHYVGNYNQNQTGGYVQVYANNFTFVTVKGAGHSTPVEQPLPSYELIRRFLTGESI